MTQPTKINRIIEMAKPRVMASLARAKNSMGDARIGEKKLDPRTIKKREAESKMPAGTDTTLTRLLYEMRQGK